METTQCSWDLGETSVKLSHVWEHTDGGNCHALIERLHHLSKIHEARCPYWREMNDLICKLNIPAQGMACINVEGQ